MKSVRQAAAAYFFLQGIAVMAWWAFLFLAPAYRVYFTLQPGSDESLMAFWLADLTFLGLGSLATAWLCFISSESRRIASWFVTGAVGYAAIYCFAFAWITDHGWLGGCLMFPAMIWSGVWAVGMSFEGTIFRPAARSSSRWIVLKTFAQIVVVWSIILGLFPYLITVLEDKLGIARLVFPLQRPVAAAIFIAISSLGIWAAYVMAVAGQGTPLPLDHAVKLVVRGPYAFVRNPMAVSGIGQGLAVALFFGSPLVAAYALMGSFIWQFVFRPLEEDDLARRFGHLYEHYRGNVRCWIPRSRAYQIEGAADSSNSVDSPVGRM